MIKIQGWSEYRIFFAKKFTLVNPTLGMIFGQGGCNHNTPFIPLLEGVQDRLEVKAIIWFDKKSTMSFEE